MCLSVHQSILNRTTQTQSEVVIQYWGDRYSDDPQHRTERMQMRQGRLILETLATQTFKNFTTCSTIWSSTEYCTVYEKYLPYMKKKKKNICSSPFSTCPPSWPGWCRSFPGVWKPCVIGSSWRRFSRWAVVTRVGSEFLLRRRGFGSRSQPPAVAIPRRGRSGWCKACGGAEVVMMEAFITVVSSVGSKILCAFFNSFTEIRDN